MSLWVKKGGGGTGRLLVVTSKTGPCLETVRTTDGRKIRKIDLTHLKTGASKWS